jgi:hypothetical protein
VTVKELATKVEALELEVARLRGELAAKSQPIVVTQPYPVPYTPPPYPYSPEPPYITCQSDDIGEAVEAVVRYIGSAS